MDMSEIAKKLGLSESKQLIRKASEIRRLADIQFDSSAIGVGEICKAIICLEIASSRMEVIFDRQAAIKLSGLSEKAYSRSFNSMQNGIGVKNKLDVRELAIRFGCIRLIPLVLKGLSLYKERFLTSLPSSRRASTDFTRPVFTAVAFYLCAKRHKLKADKIKLIELAGSSESEFSTVRKSSCLQKVVCTRKIYLFLSTWHIMNAHLMTQFQVSTSMKDICFDAFGTTKEKKDPKDVKGNRELLNALPEKRRLEDGGYSSDDGEEPSAYKKRKQMDNRDYNEWKSAVLQSNNTAKAKAPAKRSRQSGLNFEKKAPETSMEAT
ncbi:origin of replication complex subunit 6 [Olea europaea subsp. europaea]|uniref:Origin of replication complex subunit 6 n=1 Tax=Olea europaea subsp. europaea TaxID=158383 RepID=A0A8S0UI84_OLEEU|nr:origin of replication complex subunit 6 [Olea europaea subsp. europaea]